MSAINQKPETGFALATLIFFLTAATILIAAIVPVYQMQAKRAQEEELIFRGEEYMRAIQKFQRKFGGWPPSVDALVETNGLRFLRKPYKDPITGKAFRLITINPDGSLNGSKLFKANNPFAANGSPQNQQNSPFGQQPGAQNSPFSQTPQTAGFPQQNSGQGVPPQQQQQMQGGQQPFQQQPNPQAFQPGQQLQNSSPGLSGQSGSSNPTPVGAGIIGVASDSDLDSIKVYNTRQKYSEWEFVAVLNQTNPAQQQQNLQNMQQNILRNQRQNLQNQMQNNGTSPFGGGLPNSPNFPQPGSNQPQSPFGFGSPQPQPQPRPQIRNPE